MKTATLRFSRVSGTAHTYDVETEWRSGDFIWCGRIVLQPWEKDGPGYRVTRGAFDPVAQDLIRANRHVIAGKQELTVRIIAK